MRVSVKLISVVFAVALGSASVAVAAPPPPMTVVLHQASGLPISYFQLQAKPGTYQSVGTLELRNRGRRPVSVLLDPLDGVTATTLGSAYDVRGLSVHGPSRWTRLSSRRVVLAARGRASVAVAVSLPPGAQPGDYLSGIGVQALVAPRPVKVRANVAISSTQRYAIGLEVRVPGPRHPLIDLTSAAIMRDPAGVTFAVHMRNAGNVILQNVHGTVLITRGQRVVARVPLGPGTFITGTSIAYPIPTPREQPQQGAVYRVRAVVHYDGAVARLDTVVRFGRRDALRQQDFGGPKAPSPTGFPVLPVTLAVVVLGLAAPGSAFLWRRRIGLLPPLRTIEQALTAAQRAGSPLSLIVLSADRDDLASGRLAATVRARLRRSDRLCRLDDHALLVVAPDTDTVTAEALAADIGRHVERTHQSAQRMKINVHDADTTATAADLLAGITHPRTEALQVG